MGECEAEQYATAFHLLWLEAPSAPRLTRLAEVGEMKRKPHLAIRVIIASF